VSRRESRCKGAELVIGFKEIAAVP
jgi:hypothetical protein